jgi:hypothetical protein
VLPDTVGLVVTVASTTGRVVTVADTRGRVMTVAETCRPNGAAPDDSGKNRGANIEPG